MSRELADGGALPWFQGLMQTRDEAEQGGLGEQPCGHRLDHGRSALERDHLSTQQVHDMGDDPGSVLHRARHGRGEAALGPGVAARTGLDLGADLTFDGLEDDIDLDALLVCGARGPGQVVSRTAGTPGDPLGGGDRAVRRLSERAWRAFGPRLRDPRFAFGVWVWPSSVPSRELGRPELREVFGVVLSRNTATTISTSMNRALISARVSALASPCCLMASNWARAVVELRAQRSVVDPRHHWASTAMIAESTARRSPAGMVL